MNACEMVARCMLHQQKWEYISVAGLTYHPSQSVDDSGESVPLEEMGNGEVLTLDQEAVTP